MRSPFAPTLRSSICVVVDLCITRDQDTLLTPNELITHTTMYTRPLSRLLYVHPTQSLRRFANATITLDDTYGGLAHRV